jgi:hypothetical protein
MGVRLASVHPAISPSIAAGMSAHELLYFTDTPVSHVAAYRDFERDLIRERRNRDIIRADQKRRTEIARFLGDAADAMLLMQPDR